MLELLEEAHVQVSRAVRIDDKGPVISAVGSEEPGVVIDKQVHFDELLLADLFGVDRLIHG